MKCEMLPGLASSGYFGYLCAMDCRPDILIRNATADDVPFVAACVLAAVGLYDFRTESVETPTAEEACSRDDTLYSYRNARIATVDGTPIGCLVSYPGAIYEPARKTTFAIFERDGHHVPPTDTECFPDEYYLDSMAILPAFRGYGIGKLLMQDGIRIASEAGLKKVSLLVESGRDALAKYYGSLGFLPEREIDAFGDRYTRMVLSM